MNAPRSPLNWHHARLAVCLLAAAALLGVAWVRAERRVVPPVVHAAAMRTDASLKGASRTPVSDPQLRGSSPPQLDTPTGDVDARIDRFRMSTGVTPEEPVVPPESRWRIEFSAGLTIVPYAAQLDAVGIELAVITPGDEIVYVTGLSRETPKIRRGSRNKESRFYLTWGRGDLEELDRVLLSNAGIDIGEGVVVHFLTADAERNMLDFEQKFKKQPLERIAQTVFRIRKTFRGYEVYVDRQSYR